MADARRVLLTGAFGTVGGETLKALVHAGYRVTALDVRSDASTARQAQLAKTLDFETAWVDITDKAAVGSLLTTSGFEAILHVAAIIPPLAYTRPDLARAVNVDGTRNLIEAAEGLDPKPRFIYTSSYSVHGPRNPHRGLPPLTAESPVAPADNYACHKLECERAPVEPWAVTDFQAVAQGYVSLTPVHYELTSRPGLADLLRWPLTTLARSDDGAAAHEDAPAATRTSGGAS